MPAIIHIEDGEPTGWVIGKDLNDCLLQLDTVSDDEQLELYNLIKSKGELWRGKHNFLEDYWVLI